MEVQAKAPLPLQGPLHVSRTHPNERPPPYTKGNPRPGESEAHTRLRNNAKHFDRFGNPLFSFRRPYARPKSPVRPPAPPAAQPSSSPEAVEKAAEGPQKSDNVDIKEKGPVAGTAANNQATTATAAISTAPTATAVPAAPTALTAPTAPTAPTASTATAATAATSVAPLISIATKEDVGAAQPTTTAAESPKAGRASEKKPFGRIADRFSNEGFVRRGLGDHIPRRSLDFSMAPQPVPRSPTVTRQRSTTSQGDRNSASSGLVNGTANANGSPVVPRAQLVLRRRPGARSADRSCPKPRPNEPHVLLAAQRIGLILPPDSSPSAGQKSGNAGANGEGSHFVKQNKFARVRASRYSNNALKHTDPSKVVYYTKWDYSELEIDYFGRHGYVFIYVDIEAAEDARVDLRSPVEPTPVHPDDEGAPADPDRDVHQLADWNGEWAPGPVDWEDRAHFVDRAFRDRIDSYLGKVETGPAVNMTQPEFRETAMLEVAPRIWVPNSIENSPATAWWQANAVNPLGDSQGSAMPWWACFLSPTSELILEWRAPSAPLDTADVEFMKNGRHGSSKSAMVSALKSAKKKRHERKKSRRVALEIAQEHDDNLIVPYGEKQIIIAESVFLREALSFDTTQILDIFNHYILNTVHVPERAELMVEEMRERLNDVKDRLFPVIVAIDRMQSPADEQGRRHPSSEKVVGFAYADDMHSSQGMFRYSCEMEIYTQPNCYRRGIGNALMDKMNLLLDPTYFPRGGYAFHGSGIKFEPGGRRVIGAIICQVPYFQEEENERLKWVGKWLQGFDFKQVGCLPEVGVKLQKFVNMAIFHRKTGTHINPISAL